MACEYCSETNFFLADLEALGPCVCVTPDKMAQMAICVSVGDEDREDAATTIIGLTEERDEALAIIGTAGDHLVSFLVRHGLSPRAIKLDDKDLDELLNLLGD